MGIHFRLLFAGFLLITATTFVFGYMGIRMSHQFIQTRFEERIRFLARYLALNAELGILIDERTLLERLARNLLSEKDVARVTILNRFDEPLAEVSQGASGPMEIVQEPVFLKEVREESHLFLWQSDQGPKDNIIGQVRIAYTTEGIKDLQRIMKIRFLWLAVGLACLAVLIFFFISRSVVAPVTQLAHAARQVAGGNLKLRVVPRSNLPETVELAMAFNAMLDSIESSQNELERANQEMLRQKMLAEIGKFSMMVAHEVKNPLSIIKSSLDILKKDHTDLSGNMVVGFIEDEIRRLNRLIEEFLMFSRPSKPVFRSADVNGMVRECATRLELQTVEGVCLDYRISETAFFIDVDPDLLYRAFSNIIKNAIESNGKDNVVQIRTFQIEQKWIVEICDRGCGIPQENLEKIFEPFFTTRSKGTGLGLAYAFQVVKAHGGTISAKNRREKGAVFRIELPERNQAGWNVKIPISAQV